MNIGSRIAFFRSTNLVRWIMSLLLLPAATASGSSYAQDITKIKDRWQNTNHSVRSVVLVHSAWADGSGWKGVYDILTKEGFNVNIVQEPETSFKPEAAFKDDVEATKRVIA